MMRRTSTIAVQVAAGWLCAGIVAAQSVQRCESPDGKVTYSNTTCPAGTQPVRKIEEEPAPSTADRKAARERAQQNSRELEKLERERQREEERAARTRANAEARQRRQDAECRKAEARVRAARAEFEGATLQRRQQADRKLRLAEEEAKAACKNN
jgi:hypothetical protein